MTMLPDPRSARTLVVGGGPGGSSVATLIAQQGFDVILVEREVFPRYHIGESLLPSILEILDLLGVREKVESHGFIRKPGGLFEWGDERWDLSFGYQPGKHDYSFQVVRSEFDQLLLENARRNGVTVFEGCRATEVEFENGRARSARLVQVDGGEALRVQFQFLVDASGRSGLLAKNYLKNRACHRAFNNLALFGYWDGVPEPTGKHSGAISVGSIPAGWTWRIPLHDGTSSVGVVLHRTEFEARSKRSSLADIYRESVKESHLISDALAQGRPPASLRVEADYSYAADRFAGPGFLMVGDAACFVDPLLSTGVHLATYSALLAAASIGSILRGECSEQEGVKFYERAYRQAYVRLMFFVSTFYGQNRRKETLFWRAQNITQERCSGSDIRRAFVRLVSGLEDMDDATDAARLRVVADISRRLGRSLELRGAGQGQASKSRDHEVGGYAHGVFDDMQGLSALRAGGAVDGLYVVTSPQLGLSRT